MLAKLSVPDRGLERLECSRVALVLGADQEICPVNWVRTASGLWGYALVARQALPMLIRDKEASCVQGHPDPDRCQP